MPMYQLPTLAPDSGVPFPSVLGPILVDRPRSCRACVSGAPPPVRSGYASSSCTDPDSDLW